MKTILLLNLVLILTLIDSCTKDEDLPISATIDIINVYVLDTTSTSIKLKIDIKNSDRVEEVGLYFLNENKIIIDSVVLLKNVANGNLSKTISNLERGTYYFIKGYLKSPSISTVTSSEYGFKTHSFVVFGFTYQNMNEPYEFVGTLPGDEIYIHGKNLDSFNSDCKIIIDKYKDMFNINTITDSMLTFSIDGQFNYCMGKDFFKAYDILVKENDNLIGDSYSLNVFCEKPVIYSAYTYKDDLIEINGFLGNGKLDSLTIGGIGADYSFRLRGLPDTYYYHQIRCLYYKLPEEITAGKYQVIGYINGYADTCEHLLTIK